MKILLIAVGTRGDVEPFLAIAEMLANNKENVICCFPEQFRKITMDSGLKFVGLTPKYLQMLESNEGIIAMGGKANLIQKIKAYYFLYKRSGVVDKLLSKEQKELIDMENPDKIIYHIKANYPLIFEAQNPTKTVLVSPIPFMIHPMDNHAHIGFKNMGRFLNKLTYKLANYGLIMNVQKAAKGLYSSKEITSKTIKSALVSGKTVYTISPFLFERSQLWRDNVKILGYHERNKSLKWNPDIGLLDFIKKHKKIAFITFGSMVNGEPKQKTELIVRVLKRLKIPTIINTGDGGLIKLKQDNSDMIHYVSTIPYDWLLPQVDYIIHHGGSGTTHLAMKYGCSSIIIPHIIDQYLWNRINSNKGFGPKGVSINNLNEAVLESLLKDLVSNPSYKEKAQLAAKIIKNERYSQELLEFIMK